MNNMVKYSHHNYSNFKDFLNDLKGMEDDAELFFKDIKVDVWRKKSGDVEMTVNLMTKTVEEIVDGKGVF